ARCAGRRCHDVDLALAREARAVRGGAPDRHRIGAQGEGAATRDKVLQARPLAHRRVEYLSADGSWLSGASVQAVRGTQKASVSRPQSRALAPPTRACISRPSHGAGDALRMTLLTY